MIYEDIWKIHGAIILSSVYYIQDPGETYLRSIQTKIDPFLPTSKLISKMKYLL